MKFILTFLIGIILLGCGGGGQPEEDHRVIPIVPYPIFRIQDDAR